MSALTLGFVMGAMVGGTVGGTLGVLAMALLITGRDDHDS